jgi:hypothetical protein
MYNIFSKLDIKNIPVLDINTRAGHTDYIDFITPEDMSHSVMRGTDFYGRPFLAVKINCEQSLKTEEEDTEEDHKCTKRYEVVGTFFQRYTDSHSAVAYGTCFQQDLLYDDSRVRTEQDQEIIANRINKLLRGETIFSYGFWRYSDYYTERIQGNGKTKLWMQPRKDMLTQTIDKIMYSDLRKCVQEYI